MTGARARMLAALRGRIGRLEGGTAVSGRRVALGHAAADATLQGGLLRGALHEVFAAAGRHAAAASGFAAGLAACAAAQRPLLWVSQDFGDRESGALAMSGLAELGLDPRRVVTVRARDAEMALRVAADALACDALGAVVADLWGEVRALDLVVSRRLTLAAQASGVTCLMLRTAAAPAVSTAETRWVVGARRSPPGTPAAAWGWPVADARLVRNRHGQTGRWIMEWNCDECLFREPAHPQPASAAPVDRSHRPPDGTPWRAAAPRRAADRRAG